MKKNIAITINLLNGLWTSGVNQNAIYLAELLKKIGYEVTLLYEGNEEKVKTYKYIQTLNPIPLSKCNSKRFDLLITVGVMPNQSHIDAMKLINNNIKVVVYKCGNEFFSDMENILFNAHENRENYYKQDLIIPDQIWSIPQMEETNLFYYAHHHKQEKATVVPFIWNPTAIEDFENRTEYKKYDGKDIKNIGVLEPNISVFKNLLFPIISLSKTFDELGKNKLESVSIMAGQKLSTNKTLIEIVKRTNLFKEKSIFFEKRYPTLLTLNKFVDGVFSWQMHNALNYIYLDLAWMGYPIIHNGYMCKDVGYFYEGFDLQASVDLTKYVLENHKKNKSYMIKNRQIISRYTSNNIKLLEQYKELVEDVLSDRFKKRIYNSTNNTIS